MGDGVLLGELSKFGEWDHACGEVLCPEEMELLDV